MIDNNLAKRNSFNSFLNTYFNLFVVIFVSILLFISYLVVLKPKVDSTTAAISENISSHQRILQAEKTKLASLESAIADFGKIDQVDLDRVNQILPDNYDKELLFGELEEIITKNGFEPTSISISKEDDEAKDSSNNSNAPEVVKVSDKIGLVNINIGIAAIDYAGLKNLLGALENNLRLLDVEKVTLGGDKTVSLQLQTYYYQK